MIGRVVGKYRILEQIGEGGMGMVYRAEHVVLGSPAAIKVLQAKYTRDSLVLDRFFNEAKAASAIRHVGITEVFDFGRLGGDEAFIAMELLRGEDLNNFLQRCKTVDASVAVEITKQLLAALDAAHVAGVVHRDVKPDNIYLVPDPSAPGGLRVKVLDFGIAKLVNEAPSPRPRTKGGAILGTPAYMAPEQCKGGIEVDARADLYAVGCILFEMLTGRPPFVAEGEGSVLAMHIYEPPPRLSQLAPSLPPELDALVAKLLVKAPDDRAPSASWAIAALDRVPVPSLDGLQLKLAIPAPPDPEPAPDEDERERLPAWIPVVVLLVALAIAGGVVYWIGFRAAPTI